MTTEPSWLRGKCRAGAAALLVAAAAGSPAAHRTDEFLQTTRVSIAANEVAVTIDLTPGIDLAPALFGEFDRDGNGEVSPDEARAYAEALRADLTLSIDGRPLGLRLVSTESPDRASALQGEGPLRLEWRAALPALGDGEYELAFHNAHRPDISVYLVNVLVPEDPRVAVTDQRRDPQQRDYAVTFVVRRQSVPWLPVLVGAGVGAVLGLVLVVVWRIGRRR